MARYRGPKTKKARALGEPIFGFDKSFEKKKYPPGQHGSSKRRKAGSEYGIQLKEKQKAKYTYGLLEKQFSNLFKEAARRKGVTGENLLQLLEARLDNTVFRLGISPTRRGARQLVTHKHITVNGKLVNVPSYALKPGDKVSIVDKSKKLEVIQGSLSNKGKQFSWLDWDQGKMEGVILNFPERELIPENIKEQLIVELYSK